MADDYGSMQTRIADELARSDLTSQIKLAILTAIKYYEREPFYFNQTSVTVPSVANTQNYALPSDFSLMKRMTLTVSTTSVFSVDPFPWEWIRQMTTMTTLIGQPTKYGIFGQQFYVYPIPDLSTYTFTEYYWQKFPALSASGDTNAWMVDGEELIRCRAKWDLLTNVIRDPEEAQVQYSVCKDALDNLSASSSRRISAGRILPNYL